ncbi:MAG TPA: N-acetylmuramoyl-L-alanine amidase [Armatimonadota bacterium]
MLFRIIGLVAALCLAAPLAAQNLPKQPDTRTTPAPNEDKNLTQPVTPVTPDYPLATWIPANRRNFQRADRPNDFNIDMVVIHDIEGSAEGCLSWFQDVRARATSHYVVSASGQVYQMVQEKDVAWHAGNLDINKRSVGIENSGYAYRPGFYNPAEYEGLAKLVRDITVRHRVPRDRQHIIGHYEVPNPDRPGSFGGGSGHTDPGPYWDWDAFMTLVKEDSRLVSSNYPAAIRPGELVPVTATFTNTGDDAWVANNKGTEDPNVAAVGGTYLGTWAPFMHVSPFFNYKFTTSPTMLSSVTSGDTAPGSQGKFSFSILGPRTLGPVAEEYRVTHYPAAPKTPTAFGEVLKVSVIVKPWSMEFPAADAAFTGKGWNVKGMVRWRTAAAGDPFEWKPLLPISGKWDVYARWPQAAGRVSSAVFTIGGQKEPGAATVDQRKGRGAWVKLGRYTIDDAKALSVSLTTDSTKGTIVADCLKFEGPFPDEGPGR